MVSNVPCSSVQIQLVPHYRVGAVSGRGLRAHGQRRGESSSSSSSSPSSSSPAAAAAAAAAAGGGKSHAVGGSGGGSGGSGVRRARQTGSINAGRDAYDRRAVANYGNNGGLTTDRASGKSWVSHNGLAGWKLSMTLSYKHAPALPPPVPPRPKR